MFGFAEANHRNTIDYITDYNPLGLDMWVLPLPEVWLKLTQMDVSTHWWGDRGGDRQVRARFVPDLSSNAYGEKRFEGLKQKFKGTCYMDGQKR